MSERNPASNYVSYKTYLLLQFCCVETECQGCVQASISYRATLSFSWSCVSELKFTIKLHKAEQSCRFRFIVISSSVQMNHLIIQLYLLYSFFVWQYGDVCCVQPCFSQHLLESSEQSVFTHDFFLQHPLLSGFSLISQTAGAKGLFVKEESQSKNKLPHLSQSQNLTPVCVYALRLSAMTLLRAL